MALVPEVRVNKNGVPVVKHVNPNRTPAGSKQVGLPSPSVAYSEDLSHIQWVIKGAVRRSSLSKRESDKIRISLHPETLGYLQERMGNSRFVYHVTSALIEKSLEHRTFVHLNNLMVVLNGIAGEPHSSMSESILGLQARSRGMTMDWSKKDKSEWVKPQAVVSAVQLLGKQHLDHSLVGTAKFIRSPLLESLIMERHHEAERIASLVSERGLYVDTEDEIALVVGLLDQRAASSLTQGLL